MTVRKHRFLTRHNAASHTEFLHYAYSLPMRDLCRMLNRHQRTVQRWLDGATIISPWTIAVLKLAHYACKRCDAAFACIMTSELQKQI